MAACHITAVLLSLFCVFALVATKNVKYDLYITQGPITVGCTTRQGILINGQYPGPTIRAKKGDKLTITVRNGMPSDNSSLSTNPLGGITFHWHGLHQRGTVYYDGVSNGTQCPIAPGESFTYRMKLGDQFGTFFYHAHHNLLSAAAYGALVIDSATKWTPGGYYDDELILLLSDFYAKDERTLMAGLNSSPFVWIGNPTALTMNGKGCPYDPASSGCQCSYGSFKVQPNKVYRVRVIGASLLSYVTLSLDGHSMQIVEADGWWVQPLSTNLMTVNSGERYSFLLRTNQNVGNYWFHTVFRWRANAGIPYGSFGLSYQGAGALGEPSPVNQSTYVQQAGGLYTLKAYDTTGKLRVPTGRATKTFVLAGRQESIVEADGKAYIRWTVNHIKHENTAGALLSYAYAKQTDALPVNSRPYKIGLYDVVDVVLQDVSAINTVCEQHPWHLHGHSFWHLGGGPGNWTGSAEQYALLNYSNPVYRDMVTVYPYSNTWDLTTREPGQTPCGWQVIRFRADNPGVWNFHCHISAHMEIGMQTFFEEASDYLPHIPGNVRRRLKECFPGTSDNIDDNSEEPDDEDDDDKRK